MTRDQLFKANELSKQIDNTKKLIQFMESKIAKYNFEPPTRISGFDLCYRGELDTQLNEAEIKVICRALRTRLEELTKEFKSL